MEMLSYFSIEMTTAQFYGLFFLLGTFAVAALSDLKKLAAQREFFEVWLVFIIMMFCYDVYTKSDTNILVLKWILIVAFAALSSRETGVIFSLEIADVAAISATAALLNPFYIVVYYIVIWITNKLLTPVLSGVLSGLKKKEYPFMPVVFISTVIVILIGISGIFERIVSYLPFL
jgi:hypothetical protein